MGSVYVFVNNLPFSYLKPHAVQVQVIIFAFAVYQSIYVYMNLKLQCKRLKLGT